jgi:hypothetical protein
MNTAQCKSQPSERNGTLLRFVAAFMLALFLPAAVIAAPLRYCEGKDGHRAIEFVHTKGAFRTDTQAAHPKLLFETTAAAAHVASSHCHDKLLLPVVAKSDQRSLQTASHGPLPLPYPKDNARARVLKQKAVPLEASASRARHIDPRLRTLRTVVLLN